MIRSLLIALDLNVVIQVCRVLKLLKERNSGTEREESLSFYFLLLTLPFFISRYCAEHDLIDELASSSSYVITIALNRHCLHHKMCSCCRLLTSRPKSYACPVLSLRRELLTGLIFKLKLFV